MDILTLIESLGDNLSFLFLIYFPEDLKLENRSLSRALFHYDRWMHKFRQHSLAEDSLNLFGGRGKFFQKNIKIHMPLIVFTLLLEIFLFHFLRRSLVGSIKYLSPDSLSHTHTHDGDLFSARLLSDKYEYHFRFS